MPYCCPETMLSPFKILLASVVLMCRLCQVHGAHVLHSHLYQTFVFTLARSLFVLEQNLLVFITYSL